ncbi:Protein CBG25183 [Caenorhabditis briggsae]|uniref:Protein CBG25183 n=1 Tax=Caenorhabditis briggsae TaxID=6238 RepID=B6IM08_CAEBR|nr:Protein CBG25183 [Caenorhabditis briggsae]CAS00938.1 Protein CBG25183 [Caenorhabditis briggsae]
MIRIPPNGPTKSSATGAWSSSGARDTHCYWEILADVLRVIDAPPGTRDEVRDTVLQKNVQVAARIAQEADRIDRNPRLSPAPNDRTPSNPAD